MFANKVYFTLIMQTSYDNSRYSGKNCFFFPFFSVHNKFTKAILVRCHSWSDARAVPVRPVRPLLYAYDYQTTKDVFTWEVERGDSENAP